MGETAIVVPALQFVRNEIYMAKLWTFPHPLRNVTHNRDRKPGINSKYQLSPVAYFLRFPQWECKPPRGRKANQKFNQDRKKWRFTAVTTDERDILELLKEELDFTEKGGYGRSVRTPWQSKSTFQDSLSCLNYGYPYRAHPCNECHLLDFVNPEHRTEEVPCHFIPLNTDGETIEDLELQENQAKLEREVGGWLRARIKEIEEERTEHANA